MSDKRERGLLIFKHNVVFVYELEQVFWKLFEGKVSKKEWLTKCCPWTATKEIFALNFSLSKLRKLNANFGINIFFIATYDVDAISHMLIFIISFWWRKQSAIAHYNCQTDKFISSSAF